MNEKNIERYKQNPLSREKLRKGEKNSTIFFHISIPTRYD